MSSIAVNSITPATGSTVSIPAFVPAAQFSHRNKIINGKMEIAQRGTSFAAIANNTYSLDRWVYGNNTTAVATVTQQADVPASNEFQFSYRYAVTTADTSIAAADNAGISQIIEGYNVRDLIGRTFTLSFWVRSSKTGVHCIALSNSAQDRTYIAEYTISAANTWEYKTITVTGGLITAGTWDWTNGVGLRVRFTLAAGSTFQTTAGAWQTGGFFSTSSQVNVLDTIGNIFAITGVQLEVGSVATPFEHRPIGTELALCQRYYEKSYEATVTPGTVTAVGSVLAIVSGAGLAYTTRSYAVNKRTSPTVTFYSPATGASGVARNSGGSNDIAYGAGGESGSASVAGVGSGFNANNSFNFHFTASAEL